MTEQQGTPRRRSRVERGCRQEAEESSASYYSREEAGDESAAEPAFAPPPKWSDDSGMPIPMPVEDVQKNVYHPREATWADEREEALAESHLGYQVWEEEEQPVKREKRHPVRKALLLLALAGVLGAAAFLLYEPLRERVLESSTTPTEEPFAVVVTPEPIKAYSAVPPVKVADAARSSIAELTGTYSMEPAVVTDSHVVMRHERANGTVDFYLYTAAEGRLLCYFEGLAPGDMLPQENNTFYVAQAPYLIAANGSPLIHTENLEERMGEKLRLHPLMHGWAVIEGRTEINLINRAGQLLSPLWFSRVFPFTGSYTVGYVDTGSTADADERYLLYVLGEDGSMERWMHTSRQDGMVGCVCGLAYVRGGDLYCLPKVDAPLMNTPRVDAYPDCDAVVVKSPQNGKYGLLVHGEQHYDFVYDSILPMESDLKWEERTLTDGRNVLAVHVVSDVYPQPLSHSFVLQRDEQREYVALSAQSSYPIRLDGEF